MVQSGKSADSFLPIIWFDIFFICSCGHLTLQKLRCFTWKCWNALLIQFRWIEPPNHPPTLSICYQSWHFLSEFQVTAAFHLLYCSCLTRGSIYVRTQYILYKQAPPLHTHTHTHNQNASGETVWLVFWDQITLLRRKLFKNMHAHTHIRMHTQSTPPLYSRELIK